MIYSHFSSAKYIVVFVSEKKEIDNEYIELENFLEEEAVKVEGYLGIQSMHNETRQGLTLTYWESMEAIQQWAKHETHMVAKNKAKHQWYKNWSSYICKVERESTMNNSTKTNQ